MTICDPRYQFCPTTSPEPDIILRAPLNTKNKSTKLCIIVRTHRQNEHCGEFLCSIRNPDVITEWSMQRRETNTPSRQQASMDVIHRRPVSFSLLETRSISTSINQAIQLNYWYKVRYHKYSALLASGFLVASSAFVSPTIPQCPSTQQHDTLISRS